MGYGEPKRVAEGFLALFRLAQLDMTEKCLKPTAIGVQVASILTGLQMDQFVIADAKHVNTGSQIL